MYQNTSGLSRFQKKITEQEFEGNGREKEF